MGTTPLQGFRYPESTDNNDVPTDMAELATDAERRSIQIYSSAAARTAAFTAAGISPTEGMMSYLQDVNRLEQYDGTNWIPRRLSGTQSVSFTTLNTFTVAVSFGVTFTSTPRVYTNITSSAGAVSRWMSRAYGVTTTGFTLWVQYASDGTTTSTWSSVSVDWTAITD